MHEPELLADNLMRVDGVEFYVTVGLGELPHATPEKSFLLGKNRQMIDDVLALAEARARRDRAAGVRHRQPLPCRGRRFKPAP
jgi:hypothetical protein